MDEKIASLVRLQELDAHLDGLRQARSRLAPRREGLKAEIQGLASRQEEAKKALTQAQVDRKNLELDIDAKEQAVRKASSDLNTVKNNDAYKTLLAQIEDSKKAKAAIEDQVLELMEKIDRLQKSFKEDDKRSLEAKAGLEAKIAEVDAEEKRLEGEWTQAKAERDAFARSLPPAVLQAYENIQRGRPGAVVVVPIKGSICGGCRTTLPPNVINQVMKGKELISCDTCSRLLYIPSAPVPSA